MRTLLFFTLFLAVSPFPVQAASITGISDLEANSTASSGASWYDLIPGQDYSIDAPLTIRGTARDSLGFTGSGDTLFLVNSGTEPLLTVNLFRLGGGASLEAQGGASADTYGLRADGVTVSGPDSAAVTAAGGAGSGASGIRAEQAGFLQDGGTVNASGGAGSTADGISVQQGGYTMNGGVLNAAGGTGSNAAGIRAAGGNFTMTDGTASVRGGTSTNASGITVTSGSFVMAGGTMTAAGGTAGTGNSHGINSSALASQSGGSLTVTGGATSSSMGLYARGGLLLSGGSMNVTGGSAQGAAGIDTNGQTVTVSEIGMLSVTAGTASSAHGIFTRAFEQTGGTVEAAGSTQGNVHAISGNTFSQSGGTLTARASTAVDSRGVSVAASTQSGGSIIAYGGGYNSAFSSTAGFFTTNFTQTAGAVTGYGGTGSGAQGLSVNNTLTQNGTVAAYGGSGQASYGVGVIQTWNMNGGSLSAEGGSGSRASGASAPILNLRGGDLTAAGGSAASAHGIFGSGYYQTGGTASGTGGSVGSASGISYNSASLGAGSLTGTAGTAAGAHGVSMAQLTQTAGAVTALGGSVTGAYGVSLGYYYQNGGSLTAAGGTANGAYGMYVSTTMEAGGTIRLERPDRAGASVYVNGSGLTFLSGSVLMPVVNIGDLNGLTGSGLIQTAPGSTVTISSGASLNPWFIDRQVLLKDTITTDYVFIDTQGGNIDGVFAGERGGLAIEYTARKINNDSQYVITYERVMDTEDVIALIPCVNSRRLIEIFNTLNDPDDLLAQQVLESLEFSNDLGELRRTAAHAGRSLTPIAYAKLTGTQLRTAELVQGSFFRQLDALAAAGAGENLFSGAGYASPADGRGGWRGWAEGLYQQSSRFESRCSEFDSPKEKLYGLAAGVGRDSGTAALAAGFSYVRGTYRSGSSDIAVDNYAVTLGAKLHGLVPSGSWFSPWVSAAATYSYGDIDQKILNYPSAAWKTSSPSADTWRFSTELGNDFTLGGGFVLTPVFGLDYTHIRQGGYREKDPAGYGLRVFAGRYDSLRPRAGLALGYQAGQRLSIGVNAFYRYETMDGKSSFMYSRLSAPAIRVLAEGEARRRISGSLGASAAWRLNSRCSLTGSYDLILEDGYAASRFAVGLGVDF